MSENECTNPGGYHKIVLNVDHETFHRWKRAMCFYMGGDLDICTAINVMLDHAKEEAQRRALESAINNELGDILGPVYKRRFGDAE